MGPMFLIVLGILSALGFGVYQYSEQHRYDVIADQKNGGVFVIDRKSAAINYCTEKTCSLVGNGSLPSQVLPNAFSAMQGAIMGAPAGAGVGHPPAGMQATLNKGVDAVKESNTDDSGKSDDAAQTAAPDHADDEHDDHKEESSDESHDEQEESTDAKPEGFDFNG